MNQTNRQANLGDALAYIEANFDKAVSLAQLADLSALSVSRFATVFREQVGVLAVQVSVRVARGARADLVARGRAGADRRDGSGLLRSEPSGAAFLRRSREAARSVSLKRA